LFEMGSYQKSREKLAEVLALDPKADEAWKYVKMAGDKILIQMMTEVNMGREPRVLYELYRLHESRLKRRPDHIKRLVDIALDTRQHPRKRWDAMLRLNEVGQFVIPFIVEALGNVRDSEVRMLARVTATKMGSQATLPIIELLRYREGEEESSKLVRENAAIILGDLRDKRSIAPLKRVAEDKKEIDVVRRYAIMSLQSITGMGLDDLRSAQDYYYLDADRYLREMPGVADWAREADGVIWQLVDGKLVDRQVARFAWNELMAEKACYDCMDINPDYTDIYPLFAECTASQIAELWELLDIALERPVGRPFTEEEVTDVKSREAALLVADLSLDSSGPLQTSVAALPVPRIAIRRNRRLACLGAANIYQAIGKCLDDAAQDDRSPPKLAACVLADMAYALDNDGALLPKPGGAAPTRRGRGRAAAAAADGASLIKALRFPDERVQYAAAMAIARMNPPNPFDGADEVVDVVARAVGESGPIQVLIVEEDASIRNELAGKLRELDMGVTSVGTAKDGYARARGFPPFDVVLVSPALEADESAAWLLDKMRSDPRARPLAAGVITSYSKRDQDKVAFEEFENVKGYVPVEDSGLDFRKLMEKIAAQRGTPIMSKKRSEELSVMAAETLAQIDPHLAKINGMDVKQAGAACIASLENRDDAVRRPCIDALGRFGIVEAHEKLMAIALDTAQTLDIRAAAVRAVGQIEPQSLDRLLEMAKGEDEYILRYLASASFSQGNATPTKVKEFLDALRPPLQGKPALKEEAGDAGWE
ncbi:MAG: HEAT repeat domain-containing protein, partial [Planctomycetota bacterium]